MQLVGNKMGIYEAIGTKSVMHLLTGSSFSKEYIVCYGQKGESHAYFCSHCKIYDYIYLRL